MKWNKLLRILQSGNSVSTGNQQSQQMQLWWSQIIYMYEKRLWCENKPMHLPKKDKKTYKGKPWFLISCKGAVDFLSPAKQ